MVEKPANVCGILRSHESRLHLGRGRRVLKLLYTPLRFDVHLRLINDAEEGNTELGNEIYDRLLTIGRGDLSPANKGGGQDQARDALPVLSGVRHGDGPSQAP